MLWLRAGLLILILMAFLASLATFLLSWSTILKWEMLALDDCWIHCVGKLHWRCDYCVLWFYSLSISWTHLCWRGCNFHQDRTICIQCFVQGHISSAIYQHCVSNNYPKANISHFKIIDQESKQVAREAREAIHIRINNPALNHDMGKMYIPEIFNNLFGADVSTNESNPLGVSDNPQSQSSYHFK